MIIAKRRNRKKAEKQTNRFQYAVYIGFYAGVIWGAVKLIEFAMRFTEVVPGFLVEPYFQHTYLITRQGLFIGYLSFIGFSIVAALLYALIFGKLRGPWPGIAYGLIWWFLLYLLIGPLTEMVRPVGQLDVNSFVTDLCLFVVWGLFIGYSIAMEFTDERGREKAEA